MVLTLSEFLVSSAREFLFFSRILGNDDAVCEVLVGLEEVVRPPCSEMLIRGREM